MVMLVGVGNPWLFSVQLSQCMVKDGEHGGACFLPFEILAVGAQAIARGIIKSGRGYFVAVPARVLAELKG